MQERRSDSIINYTHIKKIFRKNYLSELKEFSTLYYNSTLVSRIKDKVEFKADIESNLEEWSTKFLDMISNFSILREFDEEKRTVTFALNRNYIFYPKEHQEELVTNDDVFWSKMVQLSVKLNHCFVTINKNILRNEYLTILHLTNGLLTILPDELFSLPMLIELDLSFNLIEDISEKIVNLPYLQRLLLKSNIFSFIPSSILKLKRLEFLDMRSNKIQVIPSTISNLKSLKRLALSINEISNIPSSIGKCKSLQILELDKNRLNTIPSSIGECKKLTVLLLSGNNISIIPENIRRLKLLKNINLNDNIIEVIPEFLSEISIVNLDLMRNRIQKIPFFLSKLSPEAFIGLQGNPLYKKYDNRFTSSTLLSLFQRRQFLVNYFSLNFGCDTPITEALLHSYPEDNEHNCKIFLNETYNVKSPNIDFYSCNMDMFPSETKINIYLINCILSFICMIINPYMSCIPFICFYLYKFFKFCISLAHINYDQVYFFLSRLAIEERTRPKKWINKSFFFNLFVALCIIIEQVKSSIKFHIITLTCSKFILNIIEYIFFSNNNDYSKVYNFIYYIFLFCLNEFYIKLLHSIFDFFNKYYSYSKTIKKDCITCEVNLERKRVIYRTVMIKRMIFHNLAAFSPIIIMAILIFFCKCINLL